MANRSDFFDLFWKIFNIAGGGTEEDITRILDSIIKSDRAKLDQYFTNVVDQIAFNTEDWQRLRKFLIDLFSTQRSLITQTSEFSDPHFLMNSELDELFRSFGFTESTTLKSFDENPLENKVQLFLDLVNLYKIKGTPRSILEVLQYYGIPKLDIYEFWLQKQDATSLIFKGDVITGTSVNPGTVILPYDLLTEGDPHWMLSKSKILELDQINKINLPSKSPYFAVQPVVEVGIENAILVRTVQDQYDSWKDTGNLPTQNAAISILGRTSSLLELYLLTLYSFQRDYDVGTNIQRFSCYDGTATTASEIIDEYNDIISSPILRARYLDEITPQNRTAYNSTIPIAPISKWDRYIDLFTREREQHFLYNKGDNAAETVLNLLNPTLISDLNSLTGDNQDILQSLLKDLAIWVRNNVGFGFVNLGYIFFGLAQLFEDLKPVINFFKPYRARLIVLELLQFKNLLTDSIPLNDHAKDFEIDFNIYDYMTGDSSPCCNDTSVSCIDTTGSTFYSRDTYDCGSYHDIGAATDISRPAEIAIEQNFCENLRCPPGCEPSDTTGVISTWQGICDRLSIPSNLDGTSAVIFAPDSTDCTELMPLTCKNVPVVHSEVLVDTFENYEYLPPNSERIRVYFDEPVTPGYILNVNLINENDGYLDTSFYGMIIVEKTSTYFTVLFSSPLDSSSYRLVWSLNAAATMSGIEPLTYSSDTYRVNFGLDIGSNNYAINASISNILDLVPSQYDYTIVERDNTGFKLQLSSPVDSTNYNIEWNIFDSTSFVPNGYVNIPQGSVQYDVDLIPDEEDDQYMLSVSLINLDDPTVSIYPRVIMRKNTNNFRVAFSDAIDSTNYYLSWAITYRDPELYSYRQESGFRWFDTMGRFDCTHGFDIVEISMERVSQVGVIIQENDFWILQEAAVNPAIDDYGLLLD